MARPGVGFDDIAGAADALLEAGERPTTERIRAKLGRGSPNTIGPLLDRWWATLGARLRQQQAKLALPDAPPEVAGLATQLWEQALASAQQVAAAGLAGEVSELAQARATLEADRRTLQAEFDARAAAMETARHAQDVAEARLGEAQRLAAQQAEQLVDLARQRDALHTRGERLEAELRALAERLREQETTAAAERDTHAGLLRAAEDRAHAEVDRARQESKELRAQLATLGRERATSEQRLRQQLAEALAAATAAQHEAGRQRGRAEALELQLGRLADLPATLQATLTQAQAAPGRRRAARRKPAVD